VHLVVEEMWQPQVERGPTTAKSRDFH